MFSADRWLHQHLFLPKSSKLIVPSSKHAHDQAPSAGHPCTGFSAVRALLATSHVQVVLAQVVVGRR